MSFNQGQLQVYNHFLVGAHHGSGELLPYLLSSLYMTTGSLPSFYMNVLHTGLCC